MVAIDFGMTYSKRVYSSKRLDVISIKPWSGCQLWTNTRKAPTCVLIKPDGRTFDSFGFDAENRYTELCVKGEHTEWYYFRGFKMMLFDKINMMLTDESGKQLEALLVFSATIRYMVEDFMRMFNSKCPQLILKEDIHWVFTVPSIWNDSAQDLMKLAAEKAGLSTKKFTIVVESLAAITYCRHVFCPGNKYVVLVADETIDFTLYEEGRDRNTLTELYKDTGGAWGGIMVDNAFGHFLAETTGVNVLEHLKKKNMEEYVDFLDYFQLKKTSISLKSDKKVAIRLTSHILEMVKDITSQTLEEIIQKSQYAKEASLIGTILRLDISIWRSFLKESIECVISRLSNLLRKPEASGVDTILMVGDDLGCPIISETILRDFQGMKVIVPQEVDYAILKGSLIFGRCPLEVIVLEDGPNKADSGSHAPRFEDLGTASSQRGDIQASDPTRPSWPFKPSYCVACF